MDEQIARLLKDVGGIERPQNLPMATLLASSSLTLSRYFKVSLNDEPPSMSYDSNYLDLDVWFVGLYQQNNIQTVLTTLRDNPLKGNAAEDFEVLQSLSTFNLIEQSTPWPAGAMPHMKRDLTRTAQEAITKMCFSILVPIVEQAKRNLMEIKQSIRSMTVKRKHAVGNLRFDSAHEAALTIADRVVRAVRQFQDGGQIRIRREGDSDYWPDPFQIRADDFGGLRSVLSFVPDWLDPLYISIPSDLIAEVNSLPAPLQNDARDKWIYDECMSGTPHKRIVSTLLGKPEWESIATIGGIKAAADRYAERHKLPPPPLRQSGRPRAK